MSILLGTKKWGTWVGARPPHTWLGLLKGEAGKGDGNSISEHLPFAQDLHKHELDPWDNDSVGKALASQLAEDRPRS